MGLNFLLTYDEHSHVYLFTNVEKKILKRNYLFLILVMDDVILTAVKAFEDGGKHCY